MNAVIVSFVTAAAFAAGAVSALAEEPQVAADAKSVKPIQVGQPLPELSLKNTAGESVALSSFHEKGPAVLVFFRGGWCPFCTRHGSELSKIHPQVRELGAQLVGISPDDVPHSKDNATKNSLPFSILSDADVTAAKALGLAFRVDDETLKKYQSFGIDLEKASGETHHALPVPAVLIVDKSGKVVFAHSDGDYRQRLDAKRIIEELKKLK